MVIHKYDKTEHIHDEFQFIREVDELGCIIRLFDEKDLPYKIETAQSYNFKQINKGNAHDLSESKLKECFK